MGYRKTSRPQTLHHQLRLSNNFTLIHSPTATIHNVRVIHMAFCFSAFISAVNHLLPFTNPGTPLLYDVIHTAILSVMLWYAPQVWEEIKRSYRDKQPEPTLVVPNEASIHDDLTTDNALNENEATGSQAHETQEREQAGQPVVNVEETHPALAHAVDDLANNAAFEAGDFVDPIEPFNAVPTGRPSPAARARDVGKKKAKSLARKDQRRAYHEFIRAQGEAQRAREREEAEAREQELAEERERRAQLEATLEERQRAVREKKRQEEKRAWEEDVLRRKKAVELVRDHLRNRGWAHLKEVARTLGGGVDESWVEKLCRADGIIKNVIQDGALNMVTTTGYVVKVSECQLREACLRATLDMDDGKGDGVISWDNLARLLEDVVKEMSDGTNHSKAPKSRAEETESEAMPPSMILDMILA